MAVSKIYKGSTEVTDNYVKIYKGSTLLWEKESAPTGIPISTLSVGSLVVDLNSTYAGYPIIWKIAAQGYQGYPVDSTTLISDKLITTHCFDGAEPENANTLIRSYGYGRYAYSNIRQWLNSSGSGGNWFVPQHASDAAPSHANNYNGKTFGYDIENGFLTNLSSVFKNSLYTTAISTYDMVGNALTINDKLFLIAKSEATGVDAFTIFPNAESLKGYMTQSCLDYLNTNNASSKLITDSNAYWLRDHVYGQEYGASSVTSAGAMGSFYACMGSYGIRPACNMMNTVRVSIEPNENGVYLII